MDLLIPGVEHRGPTHSIVLSLLVFIPLFAYYGKNAAPYFVALAQHALIGDYVTSGGSQLFWPLSSAHYGVPIGITSLSSVLLEWFFFLICFIIMLKTKDAWTLLQPHASNLILLIPLLTILLPTFLSLPVRVPFALVIPHLAYLILIILSILADLKAILKRPEAQQEA